MQRTKSKTIGMDLRERIVKSYDEGELTRQEVAERFYVSLGMVKKLLAQRKRMGQIGDLHKRSGRKAYLTLERREQLSEAIQKQPDVTLAELRERLALKCSLVAIHYALEKMKISLKKNVIRQRARARRRA
jgi:transposase